MHWDEKLCLRFGDFHSKLGIFSELFLTLRVFAWRCRCMVKMLAHLFLVFTFLCLMPWHKYGWSILGIQVSWWTVIVLYFCYIKKKKRKEKKVALSLNRNLNWLQNIHKIFNLKFLSFSEIFNVSCRALLLSLRIVCLFHLNSCSFVLHGILKTFVFLFHLNWGQWRPGTDHLDWS